PKDNQEIDASVFRLRDEVSQQSTLQLIALTGAAGCVLLIACANLANLLLTRALGRRRELAVRAALGAGRERLARQMMTESALLVGAGAALGVGLASLAVPLLTTLVPPSLPIAQSPSVDMRVLAFGIVVAFATGLSFGVAPVMRGTRDGPLAGLNEG